MTTKTTTNLRLARQRLDRPEVITGVCIAIFMVAALIGVVGRNTRPPDPVAVPTPQLPIILIATAPAAPQATPAAQVASAGPNVTQRALVAYSSPDGASAIGAIEAGRPYQVLASYGAAWLQADVSGSGVVWLRAADLLGMPGGLVDLQPTPAPRVVVVREQPVAAPAPVSQIEAAPTPAPIEPTQSLPYAAVLDREAWAMMAATVSASGGH